MLRIWITIGLYLATRLASADCAALPANADIAALAEQVQHWDQAYHEQGHSQVPDAVYDQALVQLQRWQSCSPAPSPAYRPRAGKQGHAVSQTGLAKVH